MRCFGAKNSYITALCVYGYSYSVFIPVILLCASGYVVTQWIVLSYGFLQSTSFIIVNYWVSSRIGLYFKIIFFSEI